MSAIVNIHSKPEQEKELHFISAKIRVQNNATTQINPVRWGTYNVKDNLTNKYYTYAYSLIRNVGSISQNVSSGASVEITSHPLIQIKATNNRSSCLIYLKSKSDKQYKCSTQFIYTNSSYGSEVYEGPGIFTICISDVTNADYTLAAELNSSGTSYLWNFLNLVLLEVTDT